jgi:hypothetical protein
MAEVVNRIDEIADRYGLRIARRSARKRRTVAALGQRWR